MQARVVSSSWIVELMGLENGTLKCTNSNRKSDQLVLEPTVVCRVDDDVDRLSQRASFGQPGCSSSLNLSESMQMLNQSTEAVNPIDFPSYQEELPPFSRGIPQVSG